jgi:hypothetical protein
MAAEPLQDLIDDDHYQCLLLEDLVGYRPLHEIVDKLPSGDGQWVEQLVTFLEQVYTMPVLPSASPRLADLYVAPMLRSLARLRFFCQGAGLGGEPGVKIDRLLTPLVSRCDGLEPIPPSVMHGDLNLGNIMVQGAPGAGRPFGFRLIDLDKFSRAGDLAIDIGELVVELKHRPFSSSPRLGRCQWSRAVEIHFSLIALAKGDVCFPIRIALAKARSLLKLTELYVRCSLAAGANLLGASWVGDWVEAALWQVQSYLGQAVEQS